MPTYPLPALSKFSYKENPRAFRSPRPGMGNGRLHGAVDLYAPDGTEVYACEPGKVLFPGPYPFYRYPDREGVPYVDAVEIKTPDGRTMRYCEMKFLSKIKPGYEVAEGELIGHLKVMPGLQYPGNCMLHFELYTGAQQGPLTVMKTAAGQPNVPFMRRGDLIDPTPYIDSCVLKVKPA